MAAFITVHRMTSLAYRPMYIMPDVQLSPRPR